MTLNTSSYIPTGGATATRNADVLPLPFPARPQAMTAYFRLIEMGSLLGSIAYLFQISDASNSDPTLQMFANTGVYQAQHTNGNTNVIVTLATAPDVGDETELVLQVNADGSLKLIQSINGEATTETATSGALVFALAWSGQILHVGTRGSGVQGIQTGFRNMVFHRGVQSLATMRRLAGV